MRWPWQQQEAQPEAEEAVLQAWAETEAARVRADAAVDEVGRISSELAKAKAETGEVRADRDRLAGMIAEIAGSLSQVSVYEGQVHTNYVALLVSELVRDHEELESRIEAALVFLSDGGPGLSLPVAEAAQEVIRLLRGGSRVPDLPLDL